MLAIRKGFSLIFFLTLAGHGQAEQQSAKQFVNALYTPYFSAGSADCYSPFRSHKLKRSIFSRRLLRLLDADEARTPKGYVGALDFDPICDCQDSDGMQLVKISEDSVDTSKAILTVELRYPSSSQELKRLHLHLLREANGWRLDDVVSGKQPGLRKLLERAAK